MSVTLNVPVAMEDEVAAYLRLVVPLQGVVASERFDFLHTSGRLCVILFHVVRSSFLAWSLKV